LYYSNQLVKQWFRSSFRDTSLGFIAREILHELGPETYNGGYLACTGAPDYIGTEWYRCDLIPVKDVEVPKELLVLELLQT
jgi:hypothetical protein